MDPTEASAENGAPTRWSRIEARDLEYIVQRYWAPVHAFLRRRVGSADQAEELTQELFLRFIQKDLAARASPDKGRFRQFLFHCARQFLIDHRRRMRVRAHEPLPEQLGTSEGGAEEEFDHLWYLSLLSDARKALKEELLSQQKARVYAAFRLFYFGDNASGNLSQRDVARMLETSVEQVNNHVRMARGLFRRKLEGLLSCTDAQDPAVGLADLTAFLQRRRLQGLPPSSILQD